MKKLIAIILTLSFILTLIPVTFSSYAATEVILNNANKGWTANKATDRFVTDGEQEFYWKTGATDVNTWEWPVYRSESLEEGVIEAVISPSANIGILFGATGIDLVADGSGNGLDSTTKDIRFYWVAITENNGTYNLVFRKDSNAYGKYADDDADADNDVLNFKLDEKYNIDGKSDIRLRVHFKKEGYIQFYINDVASSSRTGTEWATFGNQLGMCVTTVKGYYTEENAKVGYVKEFSFNDNFYNNWTPRRGVLGVPSFIPYAQGEYQWLYQDNDQWNNPIRYNTDLDEGTITATVTKGSKTGIIFGATGLDNVNDDGSSVANAAGLKYYWANVNGNTLTLEVDSKDDKPKEPWKTVTLPISSDEADYTIKVKFSKQGDISVSVNDKEYIAVTAEDLGKAGFEIYGKEVGMMAVQVKDADVVANSVAGSVKEFTIHVCTPGAEADCDSAQTCTVCGEVINPALGHTPGAAADCENDQTCTVCGEVLTEKLGHTAGAEADCENDQTCTVCGDVIKAALGHDYDAVVTEPTCTEAGYTTYTCSVCGDSYTDDETDALAHDYDAVVTEPTCTEAGYTTYTCSVCGDSYTDDETEALGHSYDAVVTEPTCTEAGYTTYTCSVCDDSYTDDETEALGHSYDAVVTAPTCTDKGYTTYTCSVCDDSYVADEVAALGHTEGTPVRENEVPATLNAPGSYDEVVYCSVCNEELSREPKTIDQLTGAVAEIDGTYYATLAEAVANAKDGAIITLLKSVKGSGVVIDKNITIDFGGYTYTFTTPAVGSKGTTTLGFQILQNNTVVLKNGKLEVSVENKKDYAMLIQNYADLTITGMILDGTQLDRFNGYNYSYVVSVNCGTVLIENTTIIGNDEGDAYALSADKYASYAIPNVTVKNVTVTGNISVGGGNLTIESGSFKGNGSNGLIYVESGNVEINGGTFEATLGADNYSMAIWAKGGEVVINNGTFKNATDGSVRGTDLIYASANGAVVINGGRFEAATPAWTLNLKDADRATASIVVNGGEFVNFDPMNSIAEGNGTNFVAEGKHTAEANGVYTICGKAALEAVEKNRVEADCTNNGSYDMVVYCECGKELSRETFTIDATGHSYDAVVTESTCTEAGYTTYTCSVCGDTYVADEVAALGHKFDNVIETVSGTCVDGGYTVYECACGETNTVLGELGTEHVVDIKNAKWSADSDYHWIVCDCNAKLEMEEHDALHCTICNFYRTGIYVEDGKYYFMEYTGEILKGKFYVTENASNGLLNGAGWYYADDVTGEFLNGFHKVEGTLYYFVNGQGGENGIQPIENAYYCLDWTGAVRIGKIYVTEESTNNIEGFEKGWYYTDTNGRFYNKDFKYIEEEGYTYYFENGQGTSNGVQEIDGKLYCFDWLGRLRANEVDGNRIYVTEDSGNGIVTAGWYYTDEKGAFYNERFVKIGETTYYFIKGKGISNGVHKIDGKLYCFDWLGRLRTGNIFITEDSTNGKVSTGWHNTANDGSIITD